MRPGDFRPVARDEETYALWGYELLTFALSPNASDPYQTLYEDAPSFYLYRPRITPPGATPLLVWFHGGAAGDDTGLSEPSGNCSRAAVDEMTSQILQNPSPMSAYLATEGWSMVIPRNEWCDLWTGAGGEDPVDPLHHFGYYHVDRVLDFLEAGGGGMEFAEEYAWGTSAGGSAAIAVAARRGGFSGVVADSPPCVMRLNQEESPYVYNHIFGDPALDSGAQARADAADCERLVRSGTMDAPLFLAYNRQDELVGDTHPLRLRAALEEVYGPAGRRYGSWDFDHPGPPPVNHVQSRIGTVPMGYTAGILLEFLKGRGVTWVEAEEEPHGGEEYSGEDAVLFSSGAGIVSHQAEVLYDAPLPSLPEGTVTAVLVARLPAGVPAGTEVGSFYYEDAGGRQSLSLTSELFRNLPNDNVAVSRLVPQFYATRLSFLPSAADGRIRLETTGKAELQMDSVVYLTP